MSFTASSTVLGDEASDARFARAAFECALLAAEGSELGGNRARASELALAAWPKALSVSSLVMKQFAVEPEKQGPLGPFIATLPPEFLASMFFAEAQKQIASLWPATADYASGESFDMWKLNKEMVADLEFSKRNCALIIP